MLGGHADWAELTRLMVRRRDLDEQMLGAVAAGDTDARRSIETEMNELDRCINELWPIPRRTEQ